MSSDNHHGEHADGIIEAGQKAPIYFYVLFFGLIIWGVIFMAYYLFSGWSSSQEFAEKMAAHSGGQTQLSWLQIYYWTLLKQETGLGF